MFNDLAKAIEYFEVMIQESEEFRNDWSQEWQAALDDHNHHSAVAIAAMQLILSDPQTALRLQRLQEAQK